MIENDKVQGWALTLLYKVKTLEYFKVQKHIFYNFGKLCLGPFYNNEREGNFHAQCYRNMFINI